MTGGEEKKVSILQLYLLVVQVTRGANITPRTNVLGSRPQNIEGTRADLNTLINANVPAHEDIQKNHPQFGQGSLISWYPKGLSSEFTPRAMMAHT